VLIVPTGVAVAAQLGNDNSEVADGIGRPIDTLAAEDCPELAAAAEQRGLEIENLTLVECPAEGSERDEILRMLTQLADRRAELEARIAGSQAP
jgi:hypothetical protein